MEGWVNDLGVEWMRLEGAGYPSGKDALKAHKAMHEEVYGKMIRNYPGFYIEGCQGGGKRLDLNMIRTTHGTWISDHTGASDVTRYYQTGALRVWPARYLNMAVETYRNTGDNSADGHYILSRMAAVLSFDGDIAQWSNEATKRVRQYVDIYKETRKYKEQPVFFPLPQPRNDSDWDAVVYGDGKGEAQLLFVYRMEGDGEQLIKIPDAPGEWKLLINNGGAQMRKEKSGYLISLNRNSSALWMRGK
jgi:alpha-galactosidase